MKWSNPGDGRTFPAVLALVYFRATSNSWTRRPDVHAIVHSFSMATLPDFVWVLTVVDRGSDTRDHLLTFQLVDQEGKQVGALRHIDIREQNGTAAVSNWGHLPLKNAIRYPGEYFGQILVNGTFAATTRLTITA